MTGLERRRLGQEPREGLEIPHFVGIGGQRCGSSWLYWNLREHPDISMSAKKEADFFSRPITAGRILEYNRYFEGCDRLRGEISPSYSAMYADEVRLAHELAPALKIIFVIRNPVDRLVSQVTRSLTFDQPDSEIGLLKLLRMVDSGLAHRFTDYAAAYRRWEHCFGQERIFLEKYDRLAKEPELFMEQVLTFLGIDARFSFPAEIFYRRKNKSSQTARGKIPPLLRWYIAWRWLGAVRRMQRQMDLDLSDWIDSMEQDMANGRWYYPLVAAFHSLYFYWPHRLGYSLVSYGRMKVRVLRSRLALAAERLRPKATVQGEGQ